MCMHILIAEEALQSGAGHWPSYIGDISLGLREMGDDVDVLVHQDATAAVLSRVGGAPWFSKNCWVDPSSQGALGGVIHNLTFHRELVDWFKGHAPYDWICALTMRLQHLLAFALLSRFGRMPAKTHFFLLFVQGFGRYAGHGIPTSFPNSPSTWLARFCFKLMAPAVRSGKVVLAAETRAMQDELYRFTGLPIQLAPHPVRFQLSRESSVESREAVSLSPLSPTFRSQVGLPGRCSASVTAGFNSPPSSSPSVPSSKHSTLDARPSTRPVASSKPSTLDARPSTQPLTITCPGFARYEKGADLLQDAIREILSRPDADRFHFILQWPEPFALPDGTMLGPDPELLNDPRVEFLNRSLSLDEYEELMGRTDIVILPYRRSSYHNRVSRVAIEAAGRGIPLIYTEGTWSEEVAAMASCGIPIRAEASEELAKSLQKAMDMFSLPANKDFSGSLHLREFHSVKTLRKILYPQ